MVESITYQHKKAVSTTLIILFKGHDLVDLVDDVDLTAVTLSKKTQSQKTFHQIIR